MREVVEITRSRLSNLCRRVRKRFDSRRTQNSKEFYLWCQSLKELAEKRGDPFKVSGVEGVNDKEKNRRLEEIIRNYVSNEEISDIDTGGVNWRNVQFDFSLISQYKTINRLSITNIGNIEIINAKIKHLYLGGSGKIILNNCKIEKTTFPPNKPYSLESKNSWIGTLGLREKCLQSVFISGGGILGLACPAPHENNPFLGSVVFRNTYLPRRRANSYFDGAQPYRNLRAHLLKLENTQSANIVHAVEHDIERESDPSWFNRCLSWLYSAASRYGTSTGRPLAWFAALWIVGFVVIALVDGAKVVDPETATAGHNLESEQTWRHDLDTDTFWPRIGRSAILALRSIISPLLFLDTRASVIPADAWLMFFLFFAGLAEAAFLFLFFLAIRRRFRMNV